MRSSIVSVKSLKGELSRKALLKSFVYETIEIRRNEITGKKKVIHTYNAEYPIVERMLTKRRYVTKGWYTSDIKVYRKYRYVDGSPWYFYATRNVETGSLQIVETV